MSSKTKWTDETGDVEMERALGNFRQSVHAWSEAMYSRPRTVAQDVRRRSWRLAMGCALGCVLAAGSVTGGVYEHQHRQQMARMAAAQKAEQQRLADERTRQADAELLATVDSDVSRTVPAAMEPLAQLMDEGETQ